MSNLQSYKSGVAFWYRPMKSWLGGPPNSTHKNMLDRLDKLRSALAEAQLKISISPNTFNGQECIPVGCVPPATVAISVGEGGLSQCMLGYTPRVWAWSLPLARPLKLPLGCGPENLQGMLGYTPWRLARHAGIPSPL